MNVGTGWGTVTHHFIYGDDKKELKELSEGWHWVGKNNLLPSSATGDVQLFNCYTLKIL